MSKDNKVVLPECIEEIVVPESLKDNKVVAELIKLGTIRVKGVPPFAQVQEKQARTSPTQYVRSINLGGTSAGTITDEANLVGTNTTTFTRFQASGTTSSPQSIFGAYLMNYTLPVAGRVRVFARLGPNANTSVDNNVAVFATNYANLSSLTLIGVVPVTASNTSAGDWYTVGYAGSPPPNYFGYQFFAVGTMAMGGSNPSGDIMVSVLDVSL